MKTLILVLATAFALAAQTLTLSAPATARPGTTVPVTVALAGTSEAAGVQWTFASPVTYTAQVGAAGASAAKTLSFYAPTGIATLVGINANKIVPGVLATYQVAIPATQATALTLALSAGFGATLDGAEIVVTNGPAATITMLKREDLNGDGVVDSIDLQIVIDQIQGRAPCTNADLSGDGKCRMNDAQIVVKAAQ